MTSFAPRDWQQILSNLPESPETDCSYFLDRKNRVNYFFAGEDITPDMQESAINLGFRRCGDTWYRTACSNCDLCISYRVQVDRFLPSKNQKQVLRRNRNVECRIIPPTSTREKEEIYLRYQYSQHHLKPPFLRPEETDKEFDPAEALGVMEYQMYTNPATSRELEMRIDGKLVGFGTMDLAVHTTSLVYFVFDPEYHRLSLGTLNILRSIEWSRDNGFDYVNFGYYIPGHMKMDYKARFKPAEMLDRATDNWQDSMPENIRMGPDKESC